MIQINVTASDPIDVPIDATRRPRLRFSSVTNFRAGIRWVGKRRYACPLAQPAASFH